MTYVGRGLFLHFIDRPAPDPYPPDNYARFPNLSRNMGVSKG